MGPTSDQQGTQQQSQNQPETPQTNQQSPPNIVNLPQNPPTQPAASQQSQQQQNPSGQPAQNQPRSSSDIEAENRALRTILGAHVDGINIDEELEFVGPTGKYRPQVAPVQQQESPQQENRTSRRQSVSNTRAEEAAQVDIATIDKQFDDFMQNMYGFNFDEGRQNDH